MSAARPHPLGLRRAGASVAVAIFLAGCGPPPFVVHVTWLQEVSVHEGDAVIYQGLPVGHVEELSLRQPDPDQPAVVTVTLAITDPQIRLRSADRFHQESLDGAPVVAVEPARRPSPALPDGSTVVGVAPMMTRIEAEIGEAIEALGNSAIESIEEAIDSLELPEAEEDAPDDAARPDPTTAR